MTTGQHQSRYSFGILEIIQRGSLSGLLVAMILSCGVTSVFAQTWVGNFNLRSPSWTYYDDVTQTDKFMNFELNLHQIGDSFTGTMIWDIGGIYAREEHTATGFVRPDGRLFLLVKDDEFDTGREMVLEYDANNSKISGLAFDVDFLTEDQVVWEADLLRGKWYDLDHPSFEATDPARLNWAASSYASQIAGERIIAYTGIFQEPRSVSIGSGFYWNGMGYLYVSFYPWVYLWGYDWLYVVGENEESFFLWDTKLSQWGWSQYSIYPWYYCVAGPSSGQAFSF